MFIEPKKAVTVDELLRGMIVQSGNDASIALAEAVAGSEDGVRRADEPRGRAARPHEHAFHQRDRPFASAALLDRDRSRAARGGADPRFPGRLQALFAARVPLQQHHAAQSQPPAVDRPLRRRRQDRAHGRRGLVPHRLGEARRAAAASRWCWARRRTRRAPPRRRSSSTTVSRRSTWCSSIRRASPCRACACGRARPTTSRPVSPPTSTSRCRRARRRSSRCR